MTLTSALIDLAHRMFPPDECAQLIAISDATPLDIEALIEFDDAMGGPSVRRIADVRIGAPGALGIPGRGSTRCELADRDVFRPLHYCAIYLTDPEQSVEWQARNVIQLSGAHLEQLVKRIGKLGNLPLGNLLRKAVVKNRLGPKTWQNLWSYRGIYNAAKHDFTQPLGSHLFSVQDAVLAYLIVRRLGQEIHPMAALETDWTAF